MHMPYDMASACRPWYTDSAGVSVWTYNHGTIFSNKPVAMMYSIHMQVTVAQGSLTTLQGLAKQRVADFVHGADGFGNMSPALTPTGAAASMNAASFLAQECARRPGQVLAGLNCDITYARVVRLDAACAITCLSTRWGTTYGHKH